MTHRCPLHCPYCSNLLELDRREDELDTTTRKRVFSEAAQLGVLQVHLSGGEPTARKDLATLIGHCAKLALYSTLITAGIRLTRGHLLDLADQGLDYVQLSLQSADPETNDRVAACSGAFETKLKTAAYVKEISLPLTDGRASTGRCSPTRPRNWIRGSVG